MKKLILATALTGLMGVSVALAIPSSGTIQGYQLGGGQSFSDGGEFLAVVNGGQSSFGTWCIELHDTFSPGTVYNYTLGQGTHGDPGIGGPSSPLQLGTAWLFSQWNKGTFATGFVVGEFQAALWYFQNQGPLPADFVSWGNGAPGSDQYTQDALTALGGAKNSDPTLEGTGAYSASGGAYGVQVVQLAGGQDWLYVPDGGTTIMLLGLGLVSLGLVSRRFAVAR